MEQQTKIIGLVGVRSLNSKFNADFNGNPRTLLDEKSTLFATDKSLKYTLRNYFNEQGETVFNWRRKNAEDQFLALTENYEQLFNNKPENIQQIKENLASCIDVRLFGTTFIPKKDKGRRMTQTGALQLSYGVNRYEVNIFAVNQLNTPFRNPNDKGEESMQTTLAKESKTLESHYTFDLLFNGKTYLENYKALTGKDQTPFEEDYALLKKALCTGVTNIISNTKIGNENEFVLLVQYAGNNLVQNLSTLVKVTKESKTSVVDLTKVEEQLFGPNGWLKQLYEQDKTKVSVELYYDPVKTKISLNNLLPDDIFRRFSITTLQPLN